ncbi:MAG: DUF4270 domain-containing protein, partial [Flavobacteriales bacterium]|nr:DUF4270 domain-containing protein [Flavobacteriales bacterium]
MIQKNSLKVLGLFSFISLLCLTACKRPESEVGLGIQPGSDLLNASYVDTVSLNAEVVAEDTLRSDELSSLMLGNYADPVFGFTEASFYTQLRLSGSGITFPSLYEVDSVVFTLPYTGRLYGKREPQRFEVYALTGDLYLDSTYYTNSTIATDKSVNWVLDPWEAYEINPFVYIQQDGDSLIPQLRIHLKPSFADQFFTTSSDNFADNDAFVSFFKGLTVRSATPDAGVFNLDLALSDAGVTIYYRDLDDVEPDTTSYEFVIGDLAPRFTHMAHSYIGSDLQGLSETSPLDAQVLGYVQAGASCKTHITLPYIDALKAEGRVISKAELVVPVE